MDAFSISSKSMGEMIALSKVNYKILVDIVNEVIGDGSPKEVFDELSDLRAKYPKGAKGIYLVTETGNWYYWDGEWKAGGVYQATQLSDGSVTEVKLELGLQEKINLVFQVQEEAQQAQDDINSHKLSTVAHSSSSITYNGLVINANNVKQAIDTLKQTINTLVTHAGDGTKDSEVLLSRGNYDTLPDRLDSVDEQLADIAINVNSFNVIIPEVDDTARIQRAIDATPTGGNLLFPLYKYVLSNTIFIKRPINIFGVGIGEHQATNLHFYLDSNSERDCAISIELDDNDPDSSTRNISISNINVIYEWEELGLPERIHDGISTKHNSTWTVDLEIQNVRCRRFRNGFYLYNTYLAQIRNCRATSCINGFNFAGFSTSLLVENCYSQHNTTGMGFIINNSVYSSFIACAADDNVTAYQISNCRSVVFDGCGSEGNRRTAIHLMGGNNGLVFNSFFSHQNGASNSGSNSSYGISLHADYTNINITVECLVEDSISTLAETRSFSMFFGGTPDTIDVKNCSTKKNIGADALYLGSLGINGEYAGAAAPINGYHRRGKIIYNRDDSAFLNTPGWICERTGYANNTNYTTQTVYSVNQTVNNGTYVYRCIISGTSGNNPIGTLPVNDDGTIVDGTVTWERIGFLATFITIPSLYREGDWTPTIITSGGTGGSNITYQYQTGKYIRYGKQVTIQFALRVSQWDAGATGNMFIGGLPFVVSTFSNVEASSVISSFEGLTLSGGVVVCSSVAGFSRIAIKNSTNTGVTQIQASAAANGLTLKGSITYQIL